MQKIVAIWMFAFLFLYPGLQSGASAQGLPSLASGLPSIASGLPSIASGLPSIASGLQSGEECGTPVRYPLKQVDSVLLQQRLAERGPAATLPYPVKIFVVICADNDGSNVAVTETEILRQIGNMQSFYAPRNICFILTGITQVNSTDLNSQDTDSETGELIPFLRSGHVTIFVHASLFSASGGSWNGFAYGIPNTYLSIVDGAVNSTSNLSTLAHEMGHCFGLYHTFQARTDANDNVIRENRARSGGCKNCDNEGDLLCDTDADRNIDDVEVGTSSCNYLGSATDACGSALLMTTTNIMTYGRRSCRNNFTVEQGSRARAFLITDPGLITALAEDAVIVVPNLSVNSGERIYAARNTLTVDPASTITYSGSSRTYYSSKLVTIRAGMVFTPGTNSGLVHIRAGTFCN
jgi:Metallo-peptidase family M12